MSGYGRVTPNAESPREWWIQHVCGAWIVGVGNEIGPVGIKTQSMGASFSLHPRRPLWSGPLETVEKLIAANIEKLGPPLKNAVISANGSRQGRREGEDQP